MAVEILVTSANHKKADKGFIISAKDTAKLAVSPWGNKETFPSYVIMRLPDADIIDVEPFMVPRIRNINAIAISSTVSDQRFALVMNVNQAVEFPIKALTVEFVDMLEVAFGVVSRSASLDRSQVTMDVPNREVNSFLEDIRSQSQEPLELSRFKLSPIDVDSAIFAGGQVTVNLSSLTPSIIDKDA